MYRLPVDWLAMRRGVAAGGADEFGGGSRSLAALMPSPTPRSGLILCSTPLSPSLVLGSVVLVAVFRSVTAESVTHKPQPHWTRFSLQRDPIRESMYGEGARYLC